MEDGGFFPIDGGFDAGQPVDAGLQVDGGPDLQIVPSATLDLGSIAYFASANPASYGIANVTLRNVGVRPQPADPSRNLRLGTPYWSVTPLAGTSLGEICVGAFNTAANTCTSTLPVSVYDPAIGLVADGISVLDIPVRITPNGLGARGFQLRIFTNDPDQPTTTLLVTAQSVTAPPCDLSVTPAAPLEFGVISGTGFKELSFTLKNRLSGSNDHCLVSNLRMLAETGRPSSLGPVFSLPAGSTSIDLQPGEERLVRVRASVQGVPPAATAQVSGTLEFTVADPVLPLRTLALSATIAPGCLSITPSSFDFGTVARSCNSPNRTFQIFNTCSIDAVVNSTAMALTAGETAGGPNCPGTAACPEFFVVSGIPSGTRVTPGNSTPVTFSVRYQPINDGPDQGSFVLSVTQAGQPLQYVVPLTGKSNLTGLNVDTITSGTGKADVLLVIDDSGSMGDKQSALATNMVSFLQYATANSIDFHLGVTNTELDGSTAAVAGLLHTSTGGQKILTPATPNLGTEFASLVNVGTSGYSESCMDPATRTLTAPNISDPTKNGGFLRNDATLSVVCVTDARDQAPQSPAFYLNQLMNIKSSTTRFTYNVMGPFLPSSPSGCSYDDPNDGRHDFMVAQTNGIREEICTPNWGPPLTRLGEIAFGGSAGSSFPLNARPDLAASMGIEVQVNGVIVPEIATQPPNARHWTYDAVNNSVSFEAFFQPPTGSTVVLRYLSVCIP